MLRMSTKWSSDDFRMLRLSGRSGRIVQNQRRVKVEANRGGNSASAGGAVTAKLLSLVTNHEIRLKGVATALHALRLWVYPPEV